MILEISKFITGSYNYVLFDEQDNGFIILKGVLDNKNPEETQKRIKLLKQMVGCWNEYEE